MPKPRRPAVPARRQSGTAARDQAAKLAAALALHQQGQLDQAALLYQEILQSQPQHFEAMQLLATIAMQQKNPEDAVALFDVIQTVDRPRIAEALASELGFSSASHFTRHYKLMFDELPSETLKLHCYGPRED